MNKKQTAVEWLIKQLIFKTEYEHLPNNYVLMSDKDINKIIEQAKQMEKENQIQILNDYFEWHKSMGFVSQKPQDIQEFINKKFGGNNG